MNEEQLLDFLKKNLKIKLDSCYESGEYGYVRITAKIYLGDELISEDTSYS